MSRLPSARASVAALVIGLSALTACSARPSAGESSAPPSTTPGPQAITAESVVAAFAKQGLDTSGASDTTRADCGADVGCTQAVTTKDVVVRSFPTSGRAEIYANPLNLFQRFTLTLTFTPSVSPSQRQAYQAVAARAAD
ncbi:MAG: hypothetical protein ABI181_01490 [Mycobacteriaceae bacterium]